jgi:hypothetical protein
METELHDHVHNSMTFLPIVRQCNPLQPTPSYFFKMHFSITLIQPQVAPLSLSRKVPVLIFPFLHS